MKIIIDNPSLQWFKGEVELIDGDAVRLFARYGGHSTLQQGFSLGFTRVTPVDEDIGASTELDGVLFYIKETDLWYFDGHDLHIEYNEKRKEIEYNYKK